MAQLQSVGVSRGLEGGLAELCRQTGDYTCILCCAMFRIWYIARKEGYLPDKMKPFAKYFITGDEKEILNELDEERKKEYLYKISQILEDADRANPWSSSGLVRTSRKLEDGISRTRYLGTSAVDVANFVIRRGYKLTLYTEDEIYRTLQQHNGNTKKMIEILDRKISELRDSEWPLDVARICLEAYKEDIFEKGYDQLYFKYAPDLGAVIETKKKKQPIINLNLDKVKKQANTDVQCHLKRYTDRNRDVLGHRVLVTDTDDAHIHVFEPYEGQICAFERENILSALENEIMIIEALPESLYREFAELRI